MEQLDRYINHKICKLLPSKMSCETYTPYAGADSKLLHKYGKLPYTSTCELTKLYIQERTRKVSPNGKR